jgi:photosystem II stability/assembly factor-like uncharacterized protein
MLAACGPDVLTSTDEPWPATQEGEFNPKAIASLDGRTIVVVRASDEHLQVVRSEDGGATWTRTSASLPPFWTVAMLDDQHLFGATACQTPAAAGEPTGPAPTSCLFRSDDGGRTWTDAAAGRLVDPSFADPLHGWAHRPIDRYAGDPPADALYGTSDGGRTWQPRSSPCAEPMPLVERAIATGPEAGFIVCSAPYEPGVPWDWRLVEVVAGAEPTLLTSSAVFTEYVGWRGSTMTSGGEGLLVTDPLSMTRDRAATWTEITQPDPQTGVSGSVILPDGVMLALNVWLGTYGSIAKSTDGGTSWTTLATWRYDWDTST